MGYKRQLEESGYQTGYIGDYLLDRPYGLKKEDYNNPLSIIGQDDGVEDFKSLYYGKVRPIPSQEQLQKIIKTNWMKKDNTVLDYDIINYFCTWFQANFFRNPDYKEIENESIDCIWLRCVMDVINDKDWSGEAWI